MKIAHSKVSRAPFRSLVVLGESNVAGGGWLSNAEERWADILWKLLKNAQEQSLKYHNAGLGASVISPRSPGYEASTKPSAAERLDAEVISRKPDLVVIAYGLNDMRAGMSCSAFRAEMQAIINRVRKKIRPLIVIANVYHMIGYNYYPPFNKGGVRKTKEYNRMLAGLALRHGCIYADVWVAEGQCSHVIHQDLVHANKVGNMLVAHKVFEAIVHAAPGIAGNVKKRNTDTKWTRACLKWRTTSVEKSHASRVKK